MRWRKLWKHLLSRRKIAQHSAGDTASRLGSRLEVTLPTGFQGLHASSLARQSTASRLAQLGSRTASLYLPHLPTRVRTHSCNVPLVPFTLPPSHLHFSPVLPSSLASGPGPWDCPLYQVDFLYDP